MHDYVGFEDWYRTARPGLVAAVAAFAGDRLIAQDAVDEAMARALERWDRVQGMKSPEGWAYKTAINQIRRIKRRSAAESRHYRRTEISAPPALPPWDDELVAAMGHLAVRQRTAVALHYIADMSIESTASAMGVSPGTVLSTLHSGRKALLRQLMSSTYTSAGEP